MAGSSSRWEIPSSDQSARAWRRDFGYKLPPRQHRADGPIQLMRRSILARSRNHLLSRALADQDWVLWLDVDGVEHPADVVERLLAAGKSLAHHVLLATSKKKSQAEVGKSLLASGDNSSTPDSQARLWRQRPGGKPSLRERNVAYVWG